jgi:hypothetical protein
MVHRIGGSTPPIIAVVVALYITAAVAPSRAAAQDPTAVVACPVPVSAIPGNGSLAVCVDRGAGAVYVVGDSIRICVTANIPQILIFPPPPPPTIRLTSVVDGVSQGVIFEDAFTTDARCIDRTIQPPLGQETIRAEAIGDDGRVFVTDEVSFRTVPAQPSPSPTPTPTPSPTPSPAPTPSTFYMESALDLNAPCIPEAGRSACDATRRSLWNGEAAAWAARGVTDPDARFNETVVFRVRAGDPAAIGNIAKVLGWPYLKVTLLRFAQDELVEITNLGGGAQDLTGWTVRSPANGVEVALPAGRLLQPGERCFVHTGATNADPGARCYVITAARPDLPDGIWPDAGGSIVLFAGPLGLAADDTRYSADVGNQPPPPNLQGTTPVTGGR